MHTAYNMLTHKVTTTTEGADEDLYDYPAECYPKTSKQNDASIYEEPVTTAINESFNYSAKFHPSNTIDAKQDEFFAMSITTEKNEAYKPVVHKSVECDEYDYI